MDREPRAGATAAQVKADIEAGRSGDKRRGFDPAAAPLGTDDEAAGTPASSRTLEEIRRAQARPDLDRHAGPAETVAPDAAPGKARPAATPWLLVGALIAGAAIVVVWLGLR